MLGLAQLYQIRGRVGRSDVTAHAYLFYPDARELTPGGARAPRDARRPHRARRRLRDRDARPRDPRRRRPARRRAVRATSPRSASSSTSRCWTRRSPSSPGQRRAAARPVRVDARVDAYVPGAVHRLRGAQDRPAPPARARRGRGRAARAPGGDRGPLRAAARAGREPVRDPGGEAEARAARAPTTSSSAAAGRRSARSCSARRSCARCATRVDTAVYTSAKRRFR